MLLTPWFFPRALSIHNAVYHAYDTQQRVCLGFSTEVPVRGLLEAHVDGGYAQPVAYDLHAFLQHAGEEPHLALLLQDGYLSAGSDRLTRHEGLAEAPPEGVTIGRA